MTEPPCKKSKVNNDDPTEEVEDAPCARINASPNEEAPEEMTSETFEELCEKYPEFLTKPFYISLSNHVKKYITFESKDVSGMLKKSRMLTKSIFNINRNYHWHALKTEFEAALGTEKPALLESMKKFKQDILDDLDKFGMTYVVSISENKETKQWSWVVKTFAGDTLTNTYINQIITKRLGHALTNINKRKKDARGLEEEDRLIGQEIVDLFKYSDVPWKGKHGILEPYTGEEVGSLSREQYEAFIGKFRGNFSVLQAQGECFFLGS